MRAKSLALLVLALGCGLVASIGITQVMTKQNDEPAVATGDEHTIFVATNNVALGDILSSQDLRLEEWPKDKIPEGALTKIEDVEGRRTKAKLYAGEAILENKLYPKGSSNQGPTGQIPKGYRVVPVKVDKVTGGADLIFPGDRVDLLLFVTRCVSKDIRATGTHTILQDIKVFAVNDVVNLESSEQGDQGSIRAVTISLLVKPKQAEKIALASELGKLRLIPRSPEDDEYADYEGYTARKLLEPSEAADRTTDTPYEQPRANPGLLRLIEAQAKAAAAKLGPVNAPGPAKTSVTWPIRVVSGSDVRQMVLESEGAESDPGFGLWRLSDAGSGAGFGVASDVPKPDLPAAEEEQQPGQEEQTKQPEEVDSDS